MGCIGSGWDVGSMIDEKAEDVDGEEPATSVYEVVPLDERPSLTCTWTRSVPLGPSNIVLVEGKTGDIGVLAGSATSTAGDPHYSTVSMQRNFENDSGTIPTTYHAL